MRSLAENQLTSQPLKAGRIRVQETADFGSIDSPGDMDKVAERIG